jgi:hypothetical protein
LEESHELTFSYYYLLPKELKDRPALHFVGRLIAMGPEKGTLLSLNTVYQILEGSLTR